MSGLNLNQINKISGYTRTDAHFDVLYMPARRQHTEAMRRAAMHRLAQSVVKQRRMETRLRMSAVFTAGMLHGLSDAFDRRRRQAVHDMGN